MRRVHRLSLKTGKRWIDVQNIEEENPGVFVTLGRWVSVREVGMTGEFSEI